ncbi:DUF4124 domain-containing protein [Marinobacter lipolyticus]|uniref:DUF4124 domain-containing protein n=1 Tax=Marinobacter lipolyticus TaxID=209639 RepID=UPI001BCEF17F|nr:DUF4124 domain-containing protein [Marinobacter lipolyticus]MBS8241884.1 DUF4124 domain-containing protein [Marinobacter lipolyticus]
MMMKWLIRLAFPALGVLLMLMFFGLNAPEPKVTDTAPEAQAKEEIPAFEGLVPSPVPVEGPDIVFKWQDRDGNWHYADRPPENGPWNALAIERKDNGSLPRAADANPETDWQSPYSAPFSLAPMPPANNGS